MTVGSLFLASMILFIIFAIYKAVRYCVLYGNPLNNNAGKTIYAIFSAFTFGMITLVIVLIIMEQIAEFLFNNWNYKLF